MGKKWAKRQKGFTIIELLIVIAVIGILVSITIVAYGGVQAKARDVQRKSDISLIQGYLELYAFDHQGLYPVSSGSTTINGSWSTTADASWAVLGAALAPYGKIPKDPLSPQGGSGIYSSNYAYFGGYLPTAYCGSGLRYVITYRLETEANVESGTCPATNITYSPSVTTYRKVAD